MQEDRSLGSFHGNRPQIYLLTTDDSLFEALQPLWNAEDVIWEVFDSGRALLERFFGEPPHVLICTEKSTDLAGTDIISLVKAENVYKQVCSILVLENNALQACFPEKMMDVDDFILLPATPMEMRARIELALQRSTGTLDANPLTRLPGNASIMQTVEMHISEKTRFAAAYLDIDNFKAFNDKYGFSRGDEALLVTARLLVATIMDFDAPFKFLGHIGGDDFFFLVPEDCVEAICQRLVMAYDEIIPNFYDDEDKSSGGIISIDRMGSVQKYPFMSISISVTANVDGRYTHYGEVSQSLGQIKKICKEKPGSVYVFDRRKDRVDS